MPVLRKTAIDLLLWYVAHDPMKRLPKMIGLARKLDREAMHSKEIKIVEDVLADEGSNWRLLVKNFLAETDIKAVQKLVECFFIHANLEGAARARAAREKYGCNIPWAILMDPTSGCNLSCTGCWAAQYGKKHNLPYETLDSICAQGKALGTYFFILSGGEPLVRKDDIIRLCEAHQDAYFFAFTNGTLVDEALCRQLLKVGNLALAFSIEGNEASTDMRRGKGSYRKALEGMDLLRAHRLLFGYSTCYHRYNTESVGSDEFVDEMIARGCRFVWNFTYIPVGKGADVDLLATPAQREYMYRRVREIRDTKPIFALDFWNDGEHCDGCIAGGKSYLHINANGDAEPCAFIHYSNVNIKEASLLDALRSPLFMAYRQRQPFNENMLMPCPLLDNPDALIEMVRESKAESTELEAPETVEELCAKTRKAAARWAPVAERLWKESKKERANAAGG